MLITLPCHDESIIDNAGSLKLAIFNDLNKYNLCNSVYDTALS